MLPFEHPSPTLPHGAQSPIETLRRVKVDTRIVQDFRPLAESLESELAALYWSESGVSPFTSNEVPFLINNDGRASEHCAAVFFAACQSLQGSDAPLVAMEFGAGTGLFALFFLDNFRAICEQENADFYSRLTYVVSDASPSTVERWRSSGLFERHPDRVLLAVAAAGEPEILRSLDGAMVASPGPPLAVFCNYVLDVLPAAIVRRGEDGNAEQLCLRTHLVDDDALIRQYTKLDPAQIRELASSNDAADRRKLIPLLTLFEFEAAYLPVQELPYLHEILDHAGGQARTLLNYGALQAIERMLPLLAPGGFLLIHDYGPVADEQVAGHATQQRFGASTAQGINFPFLEAMLGKRGVLVLRPEGDEDAPIHRRLVCPNPEQAGRSVDAFMHRFSADVRRYFEQPGEDARRYVAMGRRAEALDAYNLAVERFPNDWRLLGEVAEFIAFQLRDYASGLELARAALRLNPYFSAWLWNVAGDCHFCLGQLDEAHECYEKSLEIDPQDVRGNLNLAYTLSARGEWESALVAIAKGLARDARSLYRPRLLEKQQQILAALQQRFMGEQDRLLRRASRFAS